MLVFTFVLFVYLRNTGREKGYDMAGREALEKVGGIPFAGLLGGLGEERKPKGE